jgi:hypothetical protein
VTATEKPPVARRFYLAGTVSSSMRSSSRRRTRDDNAARQPASARAPNPMVTESCRGLCENFHKHRSSVPLSPGHAEAPMSWSGLPLRLQCGIAALFIWWVACG